MHLRHGELTILFAAYLRSLLECKNSETSSSANLGQLGLSPLAATRLAGYDRATAAYRRQGQPQE